MIESDLKNCYGDDSGKLTLAGGRTAGCKFTKVGVVNACIAGSVIGPISARACTRK